MEIHDLHISSVASSRGLRRAQNSSSQFGPSGNLRRSDRETGQAKVLSDEQIDRVLTHIDGTSNSPASDKVKFLLSVYAGLRAAEIAGLMMEAVVDADGRISNRILISDRIAKGRRGRIIPMHPRIRDALIQFRKAHPDTPFLAFSYRRKWIRRQGPNAVKLWFLRLYQSVGLRGCSSHSGRRTFITNMARKANLHGKSLRDVQLLAGHARLETTATYIDPSDDLFGLVASLGKQDPTPSTKSLIYEGETA